MIYILYPKMSKTLLKYYDEDLNNYEVGVDEVGRGPLFGSVYAASVILPKNSDTFNYSLLKDSKKFSSSKKLKEVAEYIKENAIAYSIAFEDEKIVDQYNILQASQMAMHKSINELVQKYKDEPNSIRLLIDGNYFKPFYTMNNKINKLEEIDSVTVEQGDNKYCSIAAASILAKDARDQYIKDLCVEYPYLEERYKLSSNKGYAAKLHREGIMEYGITMWHRKTFGICKNY
jgi:ribonuclease HII